MKYCKEITNKICDCLKESYGRVEACKAINICYDTFTVWMKIPEFSEAIKKAEESNRQILKETCIQRIMHAGRFPKYWTANAWLLERMFPDEFISKQYFDHKVQGINLTQILQVVNGNNNNKTAGNEASEKSNREML